VVADNQQVETIQKRLKTEDFAKVARTASADEETAKEGGAIGWTPRLVISDIDVLLFGLDINEVSDPISAKEGAYLIRITQRTADKARVQAILAKDFSAALNAKRRLESGASFDTLATELNTDPQLRASRGDLGLLGRGDRGGIFDIHIGGMPLNTVSEPINRVNQTIFYMVSQRTQALEVSEKNLEQLKTRALEGWLRREWDANRVNYCPKSPDDCFSNLDVDKALGEIGDVSRTKFEESATATAQARLRGNNQSPF
jgi:parvulin-like peptidyl-prolyl isomerase